MLTRIQSSEDSEFEQSREEEEKQKDKGKESGASTKGNSTPSGRPKHTDALKKATNAATRKRLGSPNLSDASGTDTSRKKPKHGPALAVSSLVPVESLHGTNKTGIEEAPSSGGFRQRHRRRRGIWRRHERQRAAEEGQSQHIRCAIAQRYSSRLASWQPISNRQPQRYLTSLFSSNHIVLTSYFRTTTTNLYPPTSATIFLLFGPSTIQLPNPGRNSRGDPTAGYSQPRSAQDFQLPHRRLQGEPPPIHRDRQGRGYLRQGGSTVAARCIEGASPAGVSAASFSTDVAVI